MHYSHFETFIFLIQYNLVNIHKMKSGPNQAVIALCAKHDSKNHIAVLWLG